MSFAQLMSLTGINALVPPKCSPVFYVVIPFSDSEAREILDYAKMPEEFDDLIQRFGDWARARLLRTIRPMGQADAGACDSCGVDWVMNERGIARPVCGCAAKG